MGNTDGNLNLDPPHYKSQQATSGVSSYGGGHPHRSNSNPYGSYIKHQQQMGGTGGMRQMGGMGGMGGMAAMNGNKPYHQQNQNINLYHPQQRRNNSASDEKQHPQHHQHNNPALNDSSNNNEATAALDIFNSEAMNVCWVFWKDNVDILPRNKQKELALLLYCHMFQKIPAARRLFIRGEIDEQALKFLDMFGYLIRQLKDYESTNTLIKTLQSLGKRHKDWGVRFEYFEPMLNSLHAALSDHFKHTYTVRVKFCMEQIFTSAANIMTGQNLYQIFIKRYAGMGDLSFLNSLEECMADSTGKEYLERFLVQSFCAELVEFEKFYKQYKGALSDTERYIISATIVKMFLTSNAKNELNIKNLDIKHKILKKIDKIQNNKGSSKKNKQEYPNDLFDSIHFWVIQQIENNSWPKFKQTISSIAFNQNKQ